MIQLKPWQWVILSLPIVGVIGFLSVAASLQIHRLHLNWIWAVILVIFVGWRFLLVRWLQSPELTAAAAALSELQLPDTTGAASTPRQQAEAKVQAVLQTAREDVPPWENWTLFFQRCRQLVEAVAQIYAPQAKRPLLNIYVPQAYSLIRGTVDDVDQWMQQLSPLLGQVTLGQAYETYEAYQKLQPAARLALKAWNWAQWVFNPLMALTRTATQGYTTQANQQLVTNLGQMLREKTLLALGEQAIALYSGKLPQSIAQPTTSFPTLPTQTLREILAQSGSAQPTDTQPVNLLLMGRTGAGKSSLINTLFQQDLATVDLLPSTVHFQSYTFQTPEGETLLLWDSPGYEQVDKDLYKPAVLEKAAMADLVLLVTPAADPALQMDLDPLSAIVQAYPDLPVLAAVTQVDRLRPFREWEPPYDWQQGDRPKERNIREAITYRSELLGQRCTVILPIVTADAQQGREAWGVSELSQAIIDALEPAKQFRLSRFLNDLDTRTQTAARIIDHYVFQMGTTQGITALLKRPLLKFLSVLLTGSPTLAVFLSEKLPLEQSPVILSKLQMAYELHSLLRPNASAFTFEFLPLWPLLLEQSDSITQDAWALGHTLTEWWSQTETATAANGAHSQLSARYQTYRQQSQKIDFVKDTQIGTH
jgi:uncharacterized protein